MLFRILKKCFGVSDVADINGNRAKHDLTTINIGKPEGGLPSLLDHEGSGEMVTIVCMKWGSEFTAAHVNALYAGVLRNMDEAFVFVCLTDDGLDLATGIDVRPIPDLGLPERAWRRGCWPKVGVFAPHLFPFEDVVLFLDLDVMVQHSLAPFIELVRRRRHLVIQREWNPDLWSLLPPLLRPDRGAQSSVFGFNPANLERVYSDFTAETARIIESFKNDQAYLSHAVKQRSYWPTGFCVSFKRSCTHYFPINLLQPKIRQPRKAKVIVFHGKPRPWETLVGNGVRWGSKRRFGIGPVPWIKRYFDQADAMLASIHVSANRESQLHLVRSPDGFSQGRLPANGQGEPNPGHVVQGGAMPAAQNLTGKVSP